MIFDYHKLFYFFWFLKVVVYKYHHDEGPSSPWSQTLPFLEKIFENKNGNAGYESAQVQAIFCDLW